MTLKNEIKGRTQIFSSLVPKDEDFDDKIQQTLSSVDFTSC